MQSPKPVKQQRSRKLKGNPARDDHNTQVSKTLSFVLRHGAKNEGLTMRPDGYVRVTDLLASPKFSNVDFQMLESIVQQDEKQRYHLNFEHSPDKSVQDVDAWWIRANQGHSLAHIKVTGEEILTSADIPMAVHGTSKAAWRAIAKYGLCRMKRNHIHLAQGIVGQNILSGMRKTSEIFIHIDVQKALHAGIKFMLSSNGVVLTEGDERGYIPIDFFLRVEERISDSERIVLTGWEVASKSREEIEILATPLTAEEVQQALETKPTELEGAVIS